MHSAKIVRDANGVPTGISTIAAETLVGGAIKSLTNALDSDSVLLPEGILDSLVIVGVPAVVGMVAQKKISTGEFGLPGKA